MSLGRLLFWILFLVVAGFVAKDRLDRRAAAIAAAAADAEPEEVPATPYVGPAARAAAELPPAPSAPAHRVLFIGNSLVSTNAMPQMLVGLAREGGVNLEVAQHTPGGSRLVQHAASPEVRALLDGGGWNDVVIQEQSQWPAFNDNQVRADVDPPATALASRARAGSAGVRMLLYLTPAKRDGDRQNSASIPELGSYEGMQTRISATYRRLGRQLGAAVAPAGEAWRAVRRERPEINLYGDETHPSREGAYLIACVFYATMFDRSPVGFAFVSGLDPSVAASLQQAAWNAVQSERYAR